MSVIKCTRCDGEVKESDKTVTAIDPSDNYTMIIARHCTCKSCGHVMYVKTGLRSDSDE